MQYMLLIYSNEKDWDKQTPEQMGEVMNAYNAFTEGIVKSGNYKAGEALQPTATATTVRVRNGKPQTLQIAARIPSALVGSIEVRPIMVFEKPSAAGAAESKAHAGK